LNDGKLIQECDGVVINSIYNNNGTTSFTRPFPYNSIHYEVTKAIPFSAAAKGVSVEFTVSETTKYVRYVFPHLSNPAGTPYSVAYECTGLDPDEDFRLAASYMSLFNNPGDGQDGFFIHIALCKKQVYLLYGINVAGSGARDRFTAAIPLFHRHGSFKEKFTFSVCLNYDGSFQVFLKDPETCNYKCLMYVPNVAVPPKDKRYIVYTTSASYAAAKTAAPTSNPVPIFLAEPITVDNLTFAIINASNMEWMDPNVHRDHKYNHENTHIPKTVLYQILNNYTDESLRYLCDCGDMLLPADAINTLADGTIASINTAQLNYGQGTQIKAYNMTVCYI
jgi:hypothetical protein